MDKNEELEEYNNNKKDEPDNAVKNTYSPPYRIIKTVLMICAWISFGLNFELIGPALEDLRVMLNVDYRSISNAFILRNTSYMVVTVFIGLVMDRLSNHSETLMAFAKAMIVIPTFLIPWIRVYWVSMSMYFVHGLAQAIYDVGGNFIILGLWNGISNSPVNAMHGGYGIGAILSVQLLKPFIKFSASKNPALNLTMNATDNETASVLTSEDIALQIPYSVAGLFGCVVLVGFLVAQYFETKHRKHVKQVQEDNQQSVPLKTLDEAEVHRKAPSFIEKLLFGDTNYDGKTFALMCVQIVLFMILFAFVSGFNNVLTGYNLTFLTRGPAKFSTESFMTLQTMYWAFFICGRFLTAYLAYKINALLFYTLLILLNFILLIFYCIPFFNTNQWFYWISNCFLGLLTGPLIPCSFMIAKHVLINVNAFLVSMFVVGLSIGGIASQYITGIFLTWEEYNPVYYLPVLQGICILSGIIIFATILIIYQKNRNIFNAKNLSS